MINKKKFTKINISKELFFLIAFLLYTSGIFFIKNTIFLIFVLALNIILIVVFKIEIKKIINYLYKCMFLIILYFIFNFLFGYFKEAFLISFRLLLVCTISFIFSSTMGFSNIIFSLEKLFTPLKVFGINPKDITLMVNIAITSIPFFIRYINQTLTTMESKGLKRYSIKSIKYTCKILLLSIFKKTNDIELTLKVKNY